MIFFSRSVRLLMAIVAVIDLAIFSQHSILVILTQAIGAALVLLGMLYDYRPSSLTGLLIVATASAAAIELPSLLEVGQILTAIVSLAIPAFVLTWLALSAEEGESTDVLLLKRPATTALVFALVCLFSAPIVVLVMSLLAPTISTRITPTTEMAIILIATTVGTIVLTRRASAAATLPATKEGT
ncbi:MAG: hypothetical protein NTY62_08225 [Euryarchaeota archaeon]|nr:hypothetical protein [Euryarchaeota archaeon]